jgi:hypothetical protein
MLNKCGIQECRKKHEEHHVEQFSEMPMCKNCCVKGLPEPNYVVFMEEQKGCLNKVECYAHVIDIKCLYQKLKEWKDKQGEQAKKCAELIEYFIKAKQMLMKETYKCKDYNIPVPEGQDK